MSRIGRLPIDIPAGVEVKIEEGNKVTVKGPKGTLEKCLPVEMTIKQEDNQVVVTRPNDLKKIEIFTWSYKIFDRKHDHRCI
mgnify:CR=1 FL=1